MLFAQLGSHPLFNPDEGLYAEPAREMLETGEYITTYLNYVVRFTKPPLVIWAMAGCFQIFGVNEFAARFFGGACGLVLVAATYWFAQRYFNWKTAALACIALVTAPLFIGTAREAITDMPLALFIGGALMAFFHAYHGRFIDDSTPEQVPKSAPWAGLKWLGYVLIGLAVMTKGPVGLVLPVGILAVYHILRSDIVRALRFYNPLPGLLIVAAIAVPWFALEIYITNGAYYHEFLVRENFQRFTAVVDHKYPWWYHIVAVMGGFLPWSLFIPQALHRAVKSTFKQSHAESFANQIFDGWRKLGLLNQQQAAMLFCLCWFVLTVCFFSISVSKLLPYTVPAFPALAMLIGYELSASTTSRKRLLIPFAFLTALFACAEFIVPIAVNRLRDAPAELVHIIQSMISAELFGCVVVLLLLVWKKPTWAIGFFAGMTVLTSGYFGSKVLDVMAEGWEGPIPVFSRYAAISSLPIFVHDMRKPGVPFYTQRKVFHPVNAIELEYLLSQHGEAYILTRSRQRDYFQSKPGFKVLSERGKFMLVKYTPAKVTPKNDHSTKL